MLLKLVQVLGGLPTRRRHDIGVFLLGLHTLVLQYLAIILSILGLPGKHLRLIIVSHWIQLLAIVVNFPDSRLNRIQMRVRLRLRLRLRVRLRLRDALLEL